MHRQLVLSELGAAVNLARQQEDASRACTYDQIAEHLGVTRQRAMQIEQEALMHFGERLALLMAVRGLCLSDLLPDDWPVAST